MRAERIKNVILLSIGMREMTSVFLSSLHFSFLEYQNLRKMQKRSSNETYTID